MKVIKEQIILALDCSTYEEATALIEKAKNDFQWIKIGMQLFYSCGPKLFQYLKQYSFNIFLDLKLYDIPNTVSGAIKSLSQFHFHYLSVHLSGGISMLEESHAATQKYCPHVKILGITVLTSFSTEGWSQTQLGNSPIEKCVLNLASLDKKSLLHGIVSSGEEIKVLKNEFPHLSLIVPGIRFSTSETQDQKRTMSPLEAFERGANQIVIGRELTTHYENGMKNLCNHLSVRYS